MHSRGRSSKSEHEDQSRDGGYMSEKKRKLEEQFRGDAPTNKEKSGTSTDIFRGVTIHVNGYTDPSSDELKRLMTIHGGMYQHYYSVSRVTHIIASNLPYAKLRQLKTEKIVKPDWITNSIEAGHLLPSLPYELYTDRSSRQNQAVLQFSKGPGVKPDAPSIPAPIPKAAPKEGGSDDVSQEQEHDEGSTLSKADKSFAAVDANVQGRANRSFGMATAGDSNFLSEFYSNSRLHYISTWGAECKAYVNELQSNGDTTFPGKQRLLAIMKERSKGQAKKCELGVVGTEDDDRDWSEDAMIDPKESEHQATGSSKTTKRKEKMRRIMHIDMDCFFVSVGLIKRPDLVDKPVAVTHSKGQSGMSEHRQEISQFEREYYEKKYGSEAARQNHKEDQSTSSTDTRVTGTTGGASSSSSSGKPKETFHSMAEIASCNYVARKAGVKNGMFMGRAKTLCPELQTIPYDFDGYKRVSQKLYDIVASYTHDIEAVSCDEMLVDISGILRDTKASAEEFVQTLRKEIKDQTRCNASAGIASNILLARMATRVAKPNGQFIVEPHAADAFIRTQPVKDLPGVGRSMTRKMETLEIKTCADLQQLSLGTVQKEFGQKTGQLLYGFCRGLDDRPIRLEQERKSVSAEVNYGIRFKQESDSEKFITELAAEVHKRLTAIKMLARTITIKLKVRHPDAPKETSKFMGHGICEDKARSCTLGQATEDVQVIQKESKKLLKELQVPAADMRGVGIQLSKLSSSAQAGTLPSKSITAFMTKPKPADTTPDSKEGTQRSTDPSTSLSSSTAPSGSKPQVRTMLNFVSKRPADAETSANAEVSVVDGKDATSKTPQKKRKSILPPLPFIPGPKELQSSHLSSHLALPSPSQIDMSVLQELPKDLQEQILESYRGQKPSTSKDTSEPSTSSGITDSSRWDQGVVGSVPPRILEELMQDDPNQGTSSLGVVEALPSFSQIDPSCLEALPAELQEELRSAYRGKQVQAHQELEPERETRKMETRSETTSPAKQSPAKSPFKIRKRGRPRKGSPSGKANNPKRPRWQMGIQQIITRIQTPPKLSSGDGRQAEEALMPSNSIPQHLRNEESNLQEERNEMEREIEEEDVNLCGAVHLWDVKVLLKEWIASTDDPVDEDIGFIVQYLRELILDKNLEMVDHVTRSLIRSVKRGGSSSWLEAVDMVIARIQHTLGQIYNTHLKMPPS